MSLSKEFKTFVAKVHEIENEGGRRDSITFQSTVASLLKELNRLESFVAQLNLFSDNESLDELNPLYIQYISVDYYFSVLYSIYLLNPKSNTLREVNSTGRVDPVEFKSSNLDLSKTRIIHFLIKLQSFKILSASQSKRLDSFQEVYNPTYNELVESTGTSPAAKRAEKIENFKLEKELKSKLEILEEYYSSKIVSVKQNEPKDELEQLEEEEAEQDIFQRFDEETVRSIFVDQLKLFSIRAFSSLEHIVMELEVLSKRPSTISIDNNRIPERAASKEKFGPDNDYGYTTKLEKVYNPNVKGKEKVSQLVSKQGKILQPFTITSNRQDLKKKVYGTGQVLPSMSVEEYLDYELANGKMMKEEVKDTTKDEYATDDSDEEVEKRNWDDWKDDNPKGSGNTGGNIG